MVANVSRAGLLPRITEKQFLAQVVELAQLCRWRCYHPWLSVRSAQGFPDLVMVRLYRILFVELKSERGTVTAAQREWLDDLALTGKVEVMTWKPSDWETLVEVLR